MRQKQVQLPHPPTHHSLLIYPIVPYIESIPSKGSPSFHGHLVRYIYKLTVGVQKPNCSAQITRIPFRVIVIPSNFAIL